MILQYRTLKLKLPKYRVKKKKAQYRKPACPPQILILGTMCRATRGERNKLLKWTPFKVSISRLFWWNKHCMSISKEMSVNQERPSRLGVRRSRINPRKVRAMFHHIPLSRVFYLPPIYKALQNVSGFEHKIIWIKQPDGTYLGKIWLFLQWIIRDKWR